MPVSHRFTGPTPQLRPVLNGFYWQHRHVLRHLRRVWQGPMTAHQDHPLAAAGTFWTLSRFIWHQPHRELHGRGGMMRYHEVSIDTMGTPSTIQVLLLGFKRRNEWFGGTPILGNTQNHSCICLSCFLFL